MADIDQILKERGTTTGGNGPHGNFHDNARISQMFKALISMELVERAKRGQEKLSHVQLEALDQFALKMSRIISGDSFYADHWDDIGGYAKLALAPSTPPTPPIPSAETYKTVGDPTPRHGLAPRTGMAGAAGTSAPAAAPARTDAPSPSTDDGMLSPRLAELYKKRHFGALTPQEETERNDLERRVKEREDELTTKLARKLSPKLKPDSFA